MRRTPERASSHSDAEEREPRDARWSKARTRDRDPLFAPATRNSLKATATRSGSSAPREVGAVVEEAEERLGHRVDVAASGVMGASVDVAFEVASLAGESAERDRPTVFQGRHQRREEERLAEMHERIAFVWDRRRIGRHHLSARVRANRVPKRRAADQRRPMHRRRAWPPHWRQERNAERSSWAASEEIFRELQVEPLVGAVTGDGNVRRAAKLAASSLSA